MRCRLLPLCVILSLLPGAFAQQEAPSDHLQLMDVFQLEHCVDPRISPDGEQVVYVRRSMNVMTDRPSQRLWIVGTEPGSEPRPLTRGEVSEQSPRWSPDGSRLAYVSSEAGSSQIHVRWMDSGDSARLTQLTQAPGSLSWSPDGNWLAFTLFVPMPPEPMVSMPDKPEGAEWAEPAVVIEKLHYRSDGAGYLEPGHDHVFVLPADGGTPRQLTHDAHDYGGPLAWTPDAKHLILSANRRPDHELEPVDTELWELSLADGRLTALTEHFGPDEHPAVSPDGAHIAFLSFDDRRQGYQVTKLCVMNRDGSGRRVLTESLDRSVEAPVWAADSSGLLFAYDDHGDTRLAGISLDSQLINIEEHLGGLSLGRPYGGFAFSLAQDGRYAFTITDTDHPSDLAVGGPRTTQSRRITHLNDDLFAFRTPGAVEEFWVESSFDGRPVQGWILTPPGFDPQKRYPLMLEIHGGPFANYGRRFSMECQLFAAAGYVVVYTNPRGSTSYGEEFGNLIHHAYPGHDYDDLMSCVDEVIGRGSIDEQRLYVTGGSGGGVLTAWIVGKTDRFRAAVVAKPVIHWTSFVLTADEYPFFTKYWFSGMPWEVIDEYWARSPLSLVGHVKTPTMLLTGEADHRTPISESEQYYQALKLRGVDTALVRIPGASHGIAARPSQLIAKVAHILAWFERYGGQDESAVEDGTR
jgi:dipeptidyl aminopeptidase/acylaminoacyl peptidase